MLTVTSWLDEMDDELRGGLDCFDHCRRHGWRRHGWLLSAVTV